MAHLFGTIRPWIGIVLGGYFLLLGFGALPTKPKDMEAQELWRKKFGPAMKVIGVIILLAGFMLLVDRK
jgi:hypothetical protein